MASIRERPRKGAKSTWAVLFRHGNKQTSVPFETRKAAENFQALIAVMGAEGAMKALNDPTAVKTMTVAKLAADFLEWKARDVTARTLLDYERDIANWILPTFGHRAADSIDETEVQRWVDGMAKQLGAKSVADRHMLLHSMFKFGVARTRRLVSQNPCLETSLPTVAKKRAKGITVPQYRAITAAADARNPDASDLIAYLGSVGWRFSEGIALPVGNVEERRDGRVWVDMTQVFRVIDNRQVLTPDAAKSYAGFRKVPVPSSAVAEMLLRRSAGKGPDEFVFTNTAGRHWNQQTFLRDTWPAILTDAGLWKGAGKSPTPHWLRHMAVAVLAAAGASPMQIQRYVGHEHVSTTMDVYGGLLGGLPTEVLDSADAILAGNAPAGLVVSGEVIDAEERFGMAHPPQLDGSPT